MASTHWSGPLAGSDKAFGGAGFDLPIECTNGETNLVGVVDDFNGVVPTEAFGGAANWETMGWILTDVGIPAADEVGMNDPADVDQWNPSCVRIFPGTTDDAGGNMQLDRINASLPASGGHYFPHLHIPETDAGAAALDNTEIVFACRAGFRADLTTTGAGDWNSKAFIGFAVAGDTGLMTAATGALTAAGAAEQLVGFHIPEDGSIDGISQRDGSTAYADGTNFTELAAAGAVDGTVANGAITAGDTMWFDLAFKLTITDWSDDNANGATEFYWRRLTPTSTSKAVKQGGWQKHGTALTNQAPNHTVGLVPTIEVINGPTAGRDGVVYLDWWAFGVSRFSLR